VLLTLYAPAIGTLFYQRIDLKKLFEQAYRVLKPGGWIETFEASPTIESDDDTVKPDSAMGQWGPIFIKASKIIGNTFTVVADDLQRKGIENAGFTDIKQWDSKVRLFDLGVQR
jgi:ubiquinone/menaquinone biosynthesis C-methylase UbiE